MNCGAQTALRRVEGVTVREWDDAMTYAELTEKYRRCDLCPVMLFLGTAISGYFDILSDLGTPCFLNDAPRMVKG